MKFTYHTDHLHHFDFFQKPVSMKTDEILSLDSIPVIHLKVQLSHCFLRLKNRLSRQRTSQHQNMNL